MMKIEVMVPALVDQRADLRTLLRQRHEELVAQCSGRLPDAWEWASPHRRDEFIYSVAEASEAALRQSLLAVGSRLLDSGEVSCRLDMLCVATFRQAVVVNDGADYLEIGKAGDDVARALEPHIEDICSAAAAALHEHLRPTGDSALPRGRALWSHRVVVSSAAELPAGGAPVLVAPGFWVADGQTIVDPELCELDQVLAALDLATVHWLTVDDLNRELFDHMRRLHEADVDSGQRQARSLESTYHDAVSVGGFVAAVEMLIEDQRLCLTPAARRIYDGYAEQWNLERLRGGLRRRSADIIEHNARRVDYMHAKQAERTNVALVLLALVTLVPGALAAIDFLGADSPLRLPSGARSIAFAVVAAVAVVALAVVVPAQRRPPRRRSE